MGLLDFISKSTGDSQSEDGSSTPQTNQTQANTQFSDISYPLPDPNPLPASQYSQYTVDPAQIQSQEINPQTDNQNYAQSYYSQNLNSENQDVLPTVNQVQTDNEVEDLTKYGDQNYNTFVNESQTVPQTQQESGVDINMLTNPGAYSQNYNQTSAQSLQSQYSMPENTQFSVNNQNAIPTQVETDSTSNIEPAVVNSDTFMQHDISDTLSTTEMQQTNTDEALGNEQVPNQVNLDIPVSQSPVPEIPKTDLVIGNELEESKSQNTTQLVSDMSKDIVPEVRDSSENIKQDTTEVLPTNTESTLTNQTENQGELQAPNIIFENLKSSATAELSELEDDIQVQSKTSEDNVKTVEESTPQTPNLEESIVKNQEKRALVEKNLTSEYEFQKIKNIAFIGLNSKTFNNVSVEIKALGILLAEKGLSLLIDANKGYGDDLINSLENISEAKVVAVHFKPFYTNYTDEVDRHTKIHDYTTVVYSDYIERLKYFIRESEAFILPESTGLLNLSTLSVLLSLQFLYQGQHKPVILVGNKWSTKIEQLKSISGLTDEEYNSIKIASTAEEALNMLEEADKTVTSQTKSKSRKFYDYREDFDEYEYMN